MQLPWHQLTRTLLLLVIFAVLWWALTDGDSSGWTMGIPAIIAACATSLLLGPPSVRLHPLGLLRFVLYFLKESCWGGVDIARRAFHLDLPMQPVLLPYPLRLPQGPSRTLFVTTMTLLPGTLGAELRGDDVIVHVLAPDMLNELTVLEQRVAGLFAIKLS
ncbi:MAG: Na+/H+ antiporter subunit E [Candidatus Competibacteraceae bacterium]|jgi:multicomponent Na+:H+ antiporter subunit E|nr:Na+/H+ antiporter subunit E [Candidatus Competibacteraceae bacterium]